MSKYKLNPILEKISSDEIFQKLLSKIYVGQKYSTLSGNETHCIINMDGKIKVKRLNAIQEPIITYEEIISVIKLFKTMNTYNTSSLDYISVLTIPTNKTPLLSILLAADIIIKFDSKK